MFFFQIQSFPPRITPPCQHRHLINSPLIFSLAQCLDCCDAMFCRWNLDGFDEPAPRKLVKTTCEVADIFGRGTLLRLPRSARSFGPGAVGTDSVASLIVERFDLTKFPDPSRLPTRNSLPLLRRYGVLVAVARSGR